MAIPVSDGSVNARTGSLTLSPTEVCRCVKRYATRHGRMMAGRRRSQRWVKECYLLIITYLNSPDRPRNWQSQWILLFLRHYHSVLSNDLFYPVTCIYIISNCKPLSNLIVGPALLELGFVQRLQEEPHDMFRCSIRPNKLHVSTF